MVSSDLTSHIPSQEGWSLKMGGRGRGLEGVGGDGGGGEPHQEAGDKEQLALTFESPSHFPSFSLPVFLPLYIPQTFQVGPRVWGIGIQTQ